MNKRSCLGFLVLCLILFCSVAFADNGVITRDGLHLEGFSLYPTANIEFEQGEKDANAVYFTLYPFSADGDHSTNINAVWNGGPYIISVEEIDNTREYLKKVYIASYETSDCQVKSSEIKDAKQVSFAGTSAVVLDSEWALSFPNFEHHFLQRQIFVPSKGFTFTITALSQEKLDEAYSVLMNMIVWDE